jgi:tetratricopeptide (TPR) repeat protein
MQKHGVFWLLAATLLTIQPGNSQAIMEYGGVNASSVGLGAGLGLSLSHGMAVTHTMQAATSAQAAILDKSRAIEQYMQMGCSYEASKQWDNAEKAYRYALQVIASRDGPGSPKSVPALQHLVSVATVQRHWNDALDMQKTLVKFAKQNPNDVTAAVKEQVNLSKLFIQTNNYPQAEVNLRESLTLCASHPSVPSAQRDEALSQYAQVMRQLDKDTVSADKSAIKTADTNETTANLVVAAKKVQHKKTDKAEDQTADSVADTSKEESAKESVSEGTLPKIPEATEILGSGSR